MIPPGGVGTSDPRSKQISFSFNTTIDRNGSPKQHIYYFSLPKRVKERSSVPPGCGRSLKQQPSSGGVLGRFSSRYRASCICYILEFSHISFAIDHRTWKTGLPVRSAVLKPCAGRLVVGWVTTSEYLLLIVFVLFATLKSG
jgi:hypothetical protein